jgi:hypothetical protein
MGTFDIGNASASDLTNAVKDFSVSAETTDGASEAGETSYDNSDWAQQLGYFKQVGILKRVINAKATWTVGKGIIADQDTTQVLDGIKGWGKDTFNTILENMIRTMQIGGDAFAEIIRDEIGDIINLKPLDPGTITIYVDGKGIIKRYEQKSKINAKETKKFKKENIFHLARNRVADEIHGDSLVDALIPTILAREEAKADYKQVMHRFVKPRWIFHLDTDDTSKIAAFKSKMDSANNIGENLYIPKDAVVPELMATAPNATLNPLAWIQSLDDEFYEESGVPRIIVGGTGGITEAAVKIAYLAFQQTIEEDQLFIEEQVGVQLGIAIDLEFPASLENELLSDKAKDGAVNIDASETKAGEGQ